MSQERRLDDEMRRMIDAAVREAAKQRNGSGWRTAMLSISGAILSIALVAAITMGSGAVRDLSSEIKTSVKHLDDKKVDKETFYEIIKRLDGSLLKIDDSLRALWLASRSKGSRPHE